MFLKLILPLLIVLSFIAISFASSSEVEQLSDTTPTHLTDNASNSEVEQLSDTSQLPLSTNLLNLTNEVRHHSNKWKTNNVVAPTTTPTCQPLGNLIVTTPETSPDAETAIIKITWIPPNPATPGEFVYIKNDYYIKDANGLPAIHSPDSFEVLMQQGVAIITVPNETYVSIIIAGVCPGIDVPAFYGSLRTGNQDTVVQPPTCFQTASPTDTHVSNINSSNGGVTFEWTVPPNTPVDAIVWATCGAGCTMQVFLNTGTVTFVGLLPGVPIEFTFAIINGFNCSQSFNYYNPTVLIPTN